MAAIYMWPVDNQVILTTTLYPVDVTEALQLSITFTDGDMFLIPFDDVTNSFGMGPDGTLEQLRWFLEDGPYDDEVTASFGMEDGTLEQLRWFFEDGPYDDEVTAGFGMGSLGYLDRLLVIGDTPDEALQISITINDTCTMELL